MSLTLAFIWASFAACALPLNIAVLPGIVALYAPKNERAAFGKMTGQQRLFVNCLLSLCAYPMVKIAEQVVLFIFQPSALLMLALFSALATQKSRPLTCGMLTFIGNRALLDSCYSFSMAVDAMREIPIKEQAKEEIVDDDHDAMTEKSE